MACFWTLAVNNFQLFGRTTEQSGPEPRVIHSGFFLSLKVLWNSLTLKPSFTGEGTVIAVKVINNALRFLLWLSAESTTCLWAWMVSVKGCLCTWGSCTCASYRNALINQGSVPVWTGNCLKTWAFSSTSPSLLALSTEIIQYLCFLTWMF